MELPIASLLLSKIWGNIISTFLTAGSASGIGIESKNHGRCWEVLDLTPVPGWILRPVFFSLRSNLQ
jgi:hypothetical protein